MTPHDFDTVLAEQDRMILIECANRSDAYQRCFAMVMFSDDVGTWAHERWQLARRQALIVDPSGFPPPDDEHVERYLAAIRACIGPDTFDGDCAGVRRDLDSEEQWQLALKRWSRLEQCRPITDEDDWYWHRSMTNTLRAMKNIERSIAGARYLRDHPLPPLKWAQ